MTSREKTLFIIILSIFTFLFFHFPANACEATLDFVQASADTGKFAVDIYMNTDEGEVNAITANFTYPKEMLAIVSITTSDSLDNVIDQDISKEGIVYLSATTSGSISGEGTIATVIFDVLEEGTATLSFTSAASILEAQTSNNVISSSASQDFTVTKEGFILPETGVEEVVNPLNALIVITLLVMILLFGLSGFTLWGGIYLSLGKWKVGGKYEMGMKAKSKKQTSDKSSKKK